MLPFFLLSRSALHDYLHRQFIHPSSGKRLLIKLKVHSSLQKIPRTVWILGFVSLLTDISSELIHSLLPLFLVSVLQAGVFSVGLIEGIAEATASVFKIFSGTLSDYLGQRKRLAVFGYGLSTLVKPLFALATSPAWVLAARFGDRVGKGIRVAPRDALVADSTPLDYPGGSLWTSPVP